MERVIRLAVDDLAKLALQFFEHGVSFYSCHLIILFQKVCETLAPRYGGL